MEIHELKKIRIALAVNKLTDDDMAKENIRQKISKDGNMIIQRIKEK